MNRFVTRRKTRLKTATLVIAHRNAELKRNAGFICMAELVIMKTTERSDLGSERKIDKNKKI
jgi:hypothetical protein